MKRNKQDQAVWYRPSEESSIFTPAVLIYPDRIEENIRRMIAIAGDASRLRPHVKTHKIAEVIRLQVQHGITRFKCATLNEVLMAANNGGTDILLAYPLLGPAIGRFLNISDRYPDLKLAVTVDSISACSLLCDEARATAKPISVFVDLDNGMHRTGIAPENAAEVIQYILDQKYLTFGGLHIYDGHIHESDIVERKAHCDRDFERVNHLVEELESGGIEVQEMACGGTPTFPIHSLHQERTLCPGTPLLWDAGYDANLPDLDFLPAAVVAGRVISKPEGNICLDLGHKSIASEMAHPRLHFFDLKVDQVMTHSEEHLVVAADNSLEFPEGDLVYALPVHVCPTMALHAHVYVILDHKVAGTWEVKARQRTYSS